MTQENSQEASGVKRLFREIPSLGFLVVKILIVLAFMGSGTGAFIYQNF